MICLGNAVMLPSKSEGLSSRLPTYLPFTIIPGSLAGGGFMLGLLESNAIVMRMSDKSYVAHLILAGGVAGVALFGVAAYRRIVTSAPGSPTLLSGIWILLVLTSAYLAFTSIDHLVFFADKDSSGILSTQVSHQVGIDCAAPYLLIRKQGKTFEYRCRHNVQLGSQFGEPFVPWPSYSSGESEQLAIAVEKLQSGAANNR